MRRAIALTLLATLLAGCQSLGTGDLRQSGERLRSVLRHYEVTLRWGDPGGAYKFLTPELQKTLQPPSGLGNVVVTDYQIVTPPRLDGRKALQRVRIGYIFKDRQVVRTLVDQQLWMDLPDIGWRRANPIPHFE